MTIPYDLGPEAFRGHGRPVLNMIPRKAGGIVCPHCLDDGHVCEDHPDFPWEGIAGTVEGHRGHGGVGMPCPACCSEIPADGTCSIGLAFTPDWKRTE